MTETRRTVWPAFRGPVAVRPSFVAAGRSYTRVCRMYFGIIIILYTRLAEKTKKKNHEFTVSRAQSRYSVVSKKIRLPNISRITYTAHRASFKFLDTSRRDPAPTVSVWTLENIYAGYNNIFNFLQLKFDTSSDRFHFKVKFLLRILDFDC